MTLTSFSYFIFLPLVYLIYYFARDSCRWLVLLMASYAFYATFKAPQLIFALMFVTVVSYVCGNRLGKTTEVKRRKYIFLLGSAVCVLLLIGIKLLPIVTTLPGYNLPSAYANYLLSIGISYFSFQAISYLADVYLEIQEPEPHIGYHALALAFFPKLLQGPIERSGDLLPQLKKPYWFDYDTMRTGLTLFTWGLFKKLVIADRLALYADQVFNHVHDYAGLPLIIGAYVYALQIYFDFSGYTDMARGTARIFGINLTENFNNPYLATSVADFWRRWHISFSRWILDYIFKPLQMTWRDLGKTGTALALFLTFLVSGIWHGLAWGYVVWGLLHGVYLATSIYYRPYQKRLHVWIGAGNCQLLKCWQVFFTFNLVSFAWIFFRGNSLSEAIYIISNIFSSTRKLRVSLSKSMDIVNFSILIAALLVVLVVFLKIGKLNVHTYVIEKTLFIRWAIYAALVVSVMFFARFTNSNFIYYRF